MVSRELNDIFLGQVLPRFDCDEGLGPLAEVRSQTPRRRRLRECPGGVTRHGLEGERGYVLASWGWEEGQ